MKTFAGRFGIGQWSFIGPGSEKKWYSFENSPQRAWDHIAEEMLLEFAESAHPIFRATTPFMSMFNDISCDRKGNKDECLRDADFVKTFAKRFGIGQWSFIGPGSEKKWYSFENSPQRAWDHIAEEMLLEFAESAHPIFRATTPLSRGQFKSKGRGKLSIHFTADQDTVDTIYRIILSGNQLSIYGAVAAMGATYFGHDLLWPRPTLATVSPTLAKVNCGHF